MVSYTKDWQAALKDANSWEGPASNLTPTVFFGQLCAGNLIKVGHTILQSLEQARQAPGFFWLLTQTNARNGLEGSTGKNVRVLRWLIR